MKIASHSGASVFVQLKKLQVEVGLPSARCLYTPSRNTVHLILVERIFTIQHFLLKFFFSLPVESGKGGAEIDRTERVVVVVVWHGLRFVARITEH